MPKLNRTALIAKLDRVFSQFVRLSHADEGGTVECVTCGKLMHWKEAHAGHLYSRRHMATRWDIRNVHPQCCGCNTFRAGEGARYSLYVIERYGQDVLEELDARSRKIHKFTSSDLEHLIAHFKERVEEFGLLREVQ